MGTCTDISLVAFAAAVLGAGWTGAAGAAQYQYAGAVTTCDATCDGFASLAVGSQMSGALHVDTGANASWVRADVSGFSYRVYNPAQPVVMFDGLNAAVANPLPLTRITAPLRETGGTPLGSVATGGTSGAVAQLDDGALFHQLVVAPFTADAAWIAFDLGTGTARVCLTYPTNGCVAGVTDAVSFAGTFTRLPDVLVAPVGNVNSSTPSSGVVFVSTDFSTAPQAAVVIIDHPGSVVSTTAQDAGADVVPEHVGGFRYMPAGDRGGADAAGVATLNVNYAAGGTLWVQLSDAVSGAVLGKAPFLSSAYRAVDFDAGFPPSLQPGARVGMLARERISGAVLVYTRDFSDGAVTRTPYFNGTWDPVGMAVFPALNGGVTASVGVVAVAQSNGRIRLDVKDVDAGGATASYPVKNLNWSAHGVAAFRHNVSAPGCQGAAVLVTNAAGRIDAALIDLSPTTVARGGGILPPAINFLSGDFEAIDIATVPAYSGSVGVDALAVLGRHRVTGKARVQVKDVATGSLLSTASFLPDIYARLELLVVDDVDGNGAPEVGVLGNDPVWPPRIYFKDSVTGDFVVHVWQPGAWQPGF